MIFKKGIRHAHSLPSEPDAFRFLRHFVRVITISPDGSSGFCPSFIYRLPANAVSYWFMRWEGFHSVTVLPIVFQGFIRIKGEPKDLLDLGAL